MKTNIVLAKGGTKERTVKLRDIKIPDIWHCAMRVMDAEKGKAVPNKDDHKKILEVWHIAHDLLRHLREEAGLEASEELQKIKESEK